VARIDGTTTGAERGHTAADGVGGVGNVTYVTTNQRSGSRAFQVDSTGSNSVAYLSTTNGWTGALDTTYSSRGAHRLGALPTTTVPIAVFATLAGAAIISARLTSAGKLQLWNETGTPAQIGSDSVATLTTGQYYTIQLRVRTPTGGGAASTAELVLDGTVVATTTVANLGTAVAGQAYWGWFQAPGASKTMLLDDIAVNNSTGGNETGYPNKDGKVVEAVPIGDSAIGNWTGGAGGVTNLWQAVDNVPPAGLGSASETDTSQIKNSTNSAVGYTANLTTYSTLGLVTGDVVTLVQSIAISSQEVTTGTRTGTQQLTSNPVVAATAMNFNEGGVAAGTYLTGWAHDRGTITYSPSVTLGSSPMMRCIKTDTGTRADDICYMGLLVEYVPAAVVSGTLNAPLGSLGLIAAGTVVHDSTEAPFRLRRATGGSALRGTDNRALRGGGSDTIQPPRTWYYNGVGATADMLTNFLGMIETEPSTTPLVSDLIQGWVVGTTAPTAYSLVSGFEQKRLESTFGATVRPSGALPDATLGDALRTDKVTGHFDAGVWALAVTVSAQVWGGEQDGCITMRIWKSASPYGTSATELTSGIVTGTTVTSVDVGDTKRSTALVSLGALDLVGEYIFFQFAWKITGAGGGSNRDVVIWYGPGAWATYAQSPPFTPTSALQATLGTLGVSATGTVAVKGTLSTALGTATSTATGTVAVTGVLSATLGVLSSTAAGQVLVQGTASNTLGTLTGAAAGTVRVAGSTSAALGSLSLTGAGTVAVTGSTTAALGVLSSTGAGTVAIVGSASPTLGTLTSTATGTVLVQATTSATLGTLTATGAGIVEVKSTLIATLGVLSLTGEGVVGNVPITGTLTAALGTLAITAAGSVTVQGTSSSTLGALTLTGVGTVAVTGSSINSLGVLSLSATGTVPIQAAEAAALGVLTATSTGTVLVTGALTRSLGTLSVTATGTVAWLPITGTLTAALGTLTGTAAATVEVCGNGSLTLVPTLVGAGTVEVQGSLVSTIQMTLTGAGISVLILLGPGTQGRLVSAAGLTGRLVSAAGLRGRLR
jgi:hypothetical protein